MHAHMHTHERYHAYTHTRCTQVHTHGRIDVRTHVCTETNIQVQTWKLEVRSKKLEIRNVAHALMNACMCERTFGCTNMHADRQMDGRTDSNICPHAHTRTYALMDARMYDQTFGRTNMHADRQKDKRTNRLTHTPTHIHTHES